MANNQYKNKVVYNGNTLIDLTGDTVTAANLAQGVTAHDASGAPITGTMTGGAIIISDTTDVHGGTIREITAQEVVNLQSGKSVTPSETAQTVEPDTGYDAFASVNVGAISSTYVGSGITQRSSTDLTASGATVSVPSGYYASNASKAVSNGSATTPATTITANPTISVNSSTGVITASNSKTQSVTPTVSAGYVSSGTAGTITVSGSNTSNLSTQAGTTITPTESQQTAVSAGKYTLGDVKVGAISSTYVGSGITQRSSSDLSASGSTVTVPSGYYSSQATKSVASGTAGTPTATKGAVSNHSVSVTPSVTNTTGYITGSTKTGTAVTVSASELVSGSQTITENDTYDVTNLAEIVVDVAGGISFEPAKDGKNHYKILILNTNYATITMRFTNNSNVDWGDGTTEQVPSATNKTHTYSSVGIYDLTFTGNVIAAWNNLSYIPYTTRPKLISAEIATNVTSSSILAEAHNMVFAYFADGCSISYYDYLCQDAYGLMNCKLPSSMTTIGQSSFENCYSLDEITIPNTVTSIGASAFRYCRCLRTVTIPATVTSIGNYAFQYSLNLVEYHLLPTTPPTLGTSALQTPTGCKIYVPSGSLTAYQTSTNWSSYASYMQGE